MDQSEITKDIIKLGKLLVKELGLDNSVDTLSRWMAHYIAKKIKEAEQLTGSERCDVEKECHDLIINLWQHRWQLPPNSRPLRHYEEVFDFLTQLNYKTPNPFYFNKISESDSSLVLNESTDPKTTSEWLQVVSKIDKVARILIEYSLNQAIQGVECEKVDEWIKNTIDPKNDHDLSTIKILLDRHPKFDPEGLDEKMAEEFIVEDLKNKIYQLEQFKNVNDKILSILQSELDSLKDEQK
ncbi:hypothetical protein [Carboxylicivirga sp. RSCT41]|uniref:hypothetical protein n=1 Tax=Carboxylicivirga agarovorans TaxID=3417570 RepID=UPI003D32A604